jgi:hypothetical protein
MTIYYTAKDIEELAAKGVQQLQIGPGITLTDFARESAQQLGIELIDNRKQQASSAQRPSAPSGAGTTRSAAPRSTAGDKYIKPSGCMHSSSTPRPAGGQTTAPSAQKSGNVDPNTVNKLIDLVGKAIKRGG